MAGESPESRKSNPPTKTKRLLSEPLSRLLEVPAIVIIVPLGFVVGVVGLGIALLRSKNNKSPKP